MKESKSLIKLREYISNLPKNITSFLYKKKGIKITKDVLEFIKENPKIEIEIVGNDYLDKPIYSTEIKIIIPEKEDSIISSIQKEVTKKFNEKYRGV